MLLPKPGPLPPTAQVAAPGGTPRLQISYVRKPRLNPPAPLTWGESDQGGARGVPGKRKSIQRVVPPQETTTSEGVIVPGAGAARVRPRLRPGSGRGAGAGDGSRPGARPARARSRPRRPRAAPITCQHRPTATA